MNFSLIDMDLRDKQNFKGKNWNNKDCWNLSAIKKKKKMSKIILAYSLCLPKKQIISIVCCLFISKQKQTKKNWTSISRFKNDEKDLKIYVKMQYIRKSISSFLSSSKNTFSKKYEININFQHVLKLVNENFKTISMIWICKSF